MLRGSISVAGGWFNLHNVVGCIMSVKKSKYQTECQECDELITANSYHGETNGIVTCLGCYHSKLTVDEVKFEVKRTVDDAEVAIGILRVAMAIFLLSVIFMG